MHNNRKFYIAGFVVSLFLAGVVSFYASSSPDGLEKVAEDIGFIETAKENTNADVVLSDYGTKGVDNERASVGIAGVVGVLGQWRPLRTQGTMFLPTIGVLRAALACCVSVLLALALFGDPVLGPAHFKQALSLGLIRLLRDSCLDSNRFNCQSTSLMLRFNSLQIFLKCLQAD